MGCTRWQMLTKIKLKLALPEIMLGLNQTIMFALSMLVITALVGTRDLGQEVYIALTKADTGRGLVAGLAVAFIAIIADRLIAAGAARTKASAGARVMGARRGDRRGPHPRPALLERRHRDRAAERRPQQRQLSGDATPPAGMSCASDGLSLPPCLPRARGDDARAPPMPPVSRRRWNMPSRASWSAASRRQDLRRRRTCAPISAAIAALMRALPPGDAATMSPAPASCSGCSTSSATMRARWTPAAAAWRPNCPAIWRWPTSWSAAQTPLPIVFGHNDLLPANILDDGEQALADRFRICRFQHRDVRPRRRRLQCRHDATTKSDALADRLFRPRAGRGDPPLACRHAMRLAAARGDVEHGLRTPSRRARHRLRRLHRRTTWRGSTRRSTTTGPNTGSPNHDLAHPRRRSSSSAAASSAARPPIIWRATTRPTSCCWSRAS